jgi:hypothetical protein
MNPSGSQIAPGILLDPGFARNPGKGFGSHVIDNLILTRSFFLYFHCCACKFCRRLACNVRFLISARFARTSFALVLATSLIRQGNSPVRDWKLWNSRGEGLQGMKRIESLRIR